MNAHTLFLSLIFAHTRTYGNRTMKQTHLLRPPHLFLPVRLGQPHLSEHLRPLLHHQSPLIRVGRDVAVMLKLLTW
jgi:hypothetical protein